jgi:acyl-CoA thioester hydrolase
MRPVTEREKFKQVIQVRVRNYEVDWQGIVHNGNYLLYFEVGRVEYLKHIGAKVDLNSIQGRSKVVLVRNEIDYTSSASFDELLNVYTRISYIRNSSFAMEGLMEKADNGQLVAFNVAYHVWLDPATNRPAAVDDEFRKLAQRFEGSDCEILWPTIKT